MQIINSRKCLNYFVKMYRKVVMMNLILVIVLVAQTLMLIYFYEKQPDRRFFSSAITYSVTEIYPLNSD